MGELPRRRSALSLVTIGVLAGAFAVLPSDREAISASASADLSGVYDVLVAGGTVAEPDESAGLFHCIARLDEIATNELAGAAVCYADAPSYSFDGPVIDPADEVPGPPPPLPYTAHAPFELSGSYDPGTDTLAVSGCLANVGGDLGPNVLVQATLAGAKGSPPSLEGSMLIYGSQPAYLCTSSAPSGSPLDPLPLRLYRVSAEPTGAAWRLAKSLGDNLDFDDDGCPDADELAMSPAGSCGDDPYNPYDSDADFNTVGNLLITAELADWDDVLGEFVPGAYIHCVTDIEHTKRGAVQPITARVQCYPDNPVMTVNCEDVQGSAVMPGALCTVEASSCEPAFPGGAPASACGDGLPGSPPPPPYGDVDPTHGALTGTYDTASELLSLQGCLEGVENIRQGPSVYTRSEVDARTGHGLVWIWLRQDLTDCQNGDPVHVPEQPPNEPQPPPQQVDCGEPPNGNDPQPCPIEIVEQAPR